jgi:hypothetical protein
VPELVPLVSPTRARSIQVDYIKLTQKAVHFRAAFVDFSLELVAGTAVRCSHDVNDGLAFIGIFGRPLDAEDTLDAAREGPALLDAL